MKNEPLSKQGKWWDVYNWASTLASESVHWDDEKQNYFFETDTVKRLRLKLDVNSKNIIGVVGLQGSGKSATLQYLCSEKNKELELIEMKMYDFKEVFEPALYLRWTPEAQKSLENVEAIEMFYGAFCEKSAEEKLSSEYDYKTANNALVEESLNELEDDDPDSKRLKSSIQKKWQTTVKLTVDDFQRVSTYERIIGAAECKELMKQAVVRYLSLLRYLFIDLPDYSKRNKNNLIKDLRDIESLWKTFLAKGNCPTIILGIQKELFGGHFFFGKLDITELTPLKPNELVATYKRKWQDFDVFTEDALLYLGQLSRGIFRRFLKYIQRCIEDRVIDSIDSSIKELPITKEMVKSTINIEQIAKDMELELSDLFNTKEQCLNCVKLLTYLQENGECNQKKIAEVLDINEMSISRLVNALEANGYIVRKRASKNEWLVNIKS